MFVRPISENGVRQTLTWMAARWGMRAQAMYLHSWPLQSSSERPTEVAIRKPFRQASQLDSEFLRENGWGESMRMSHDTVRCSFLLACVDC